MLVDRLRCEAVDHVELQMNRQAGLIDLVGSHDWTLVRRTSVDLAARALTPKVGIAQSRSTFEQASGLLAHDGIVDFLVQETGSGVADAQIALEAQGRCAGIDRSASS